MRKQMTYRVRVRRAVEEWVDVSADTPQQAEAQAALLPQVLSVFGKSAMRGDKPIGNPVISILDDGEE